MHAHIVVFVGRDKNKLAWRNLQILEKYNKNVNISSEGLNE